MYLCCCLRYSRSGTQCFGDTNIYTAWSSLSKQHPAGITGTSTNSITGTWNPATVNTATVGTTTYTFTPATGQCGTTATMNIVVSTAVTPTFTQIGPLTQNSTPPVRYPTSSNNGITGTWNPERSVRQQWEQPHILSLRPQVSAELRQQWRSKSKTLLCQRSHRSDHYVKTPRRQPCQQLLTMGSSELESGNDKHINSRNIQPILSLQPEEEPQEK